MGTLPFKVGDRVRFLTTKTPNLMRVGVIASIAPTPDNTGNLLYAIQIEVDNPTTAAIIFVDGPNILLMEYATSTRQTSD